MQEKDQYKIVRSSNFIDCHAMSSNVIHRNSTKSITRHSPDNHSAGGVARKHFHDFLQTKRNLDLGQCQFGRSDVRPAPTIVNFKITGRKWTCLSCSHDSNHGSRMSTWIALPYGLRAILSEILVRKSWGRTNNHDQLCTLNPCFLSTQNFTFFFEISRRKGVRFVTSIIISGVRSTDAALLPRFAPRCAD